MALDRFSPAVREWFATSFPEPTAAQAQGWPAIAAGEHTLILAPTGSGKTLAAFLWGIDRLVTTAPPDAGSTAPGSSTSRRCGPWPSTSRRTSGRPLQGIRLAAERLGRAASPSRPSACAPATPPPRERQQLVRHPPDLLITTPETLYLMLTSAPGRRCATSRP